MKTEFATNLKRQTSKILADLHGSKEPVLITERGQPSAYLVDVDDYELMQSRMRILEDIARRGGGKGQSLKGALILNRKQKIK